MEQRGPSLVERVLVSQLVLVIIVGVDLNILPIHLVPVEDGITVWMEAARQHTAPPKHTAHLGVWRSENRGVLEAYSSLTLLKQDNNFINPPEGKFLCFNRPAAVENTG